MQPIENKTKWLQLIRSEGIGPKRFWQLLRQHSSIEAALNSLSNSYSYHKAADEVMAHQQKGYHLLTAFDSQFSPLLRRLPDCPPVLSVYGDISCLKKPMIAIVGARNASLSGRQISFRMAQDLGSAGWKIGSGLARGIDERAHQGALATGTIAVVAGGIDCIYPAEHQTLYHKIKDNGAIISEMPLGTAPIAALFPRRNRLIAALSQAVVIIEAALKSGSLITADFALDVGVEIFAVPGSPLDPRCVGSNKLIKQGATFVENADDILNIIGMPPISSLPNFHSSSPIPPKVGLETFATVKPSSTLKDLRHQLLIDLNLTPIEFEQLSCQYDCSPTVLFSLLSELEVEGLILRHPGNRFSLSIK